TICPAHAAAAGRGRVIHAHNGGMSVARNRALATATGECVFFVDSDDVIHPRAIEILAREIEERDADVAWSAYTHSPGGLSDRSGRVICVDGKKAAELFLYQKGTFARGIGGVMIRRDEPDKLRFREGIRYEDLEFLALYLAGTRRVAACDFPLYFYRPNPKSITGKWHPGRVDVLDVTARIEGAFRHDGALLRAARERSLSAAFNIFVLNARHGRDSGVAGRCFGIIRERRAGSLLNGRVRIKSKAGALLSYLGPRVLTIIGRL
ncbi:MAG: glycosyltransferase, partial [Muribaculaceae bacterium]|nr:glycosyltransferase [Muribaculaceae bacterium]